MDDILIENLSAEEHQALVCMYFAKLPSSDPRSKKMKDDFAVLESFFGKTFYTYRNYRDAYDYFFDSNGRKGWERESVDSIGIAHKAVYEKYKDYDVDVLEKAVDKIIAMYARNCNKNYDNLVSLKCIQPDVAHAVLSREPVITISDIYTLADKLTLNNTVFLTLGGDRGNSEVDWEPGFRAIAHVVKAPYGHGYRSEAKYFKIDLKLDVVLPEAMTRNDFLDYKSAWNVTFIGPELKRDPTQAVGSITYNEAVAVTRCALDRFPEIKDSLEKIFSKSFMNKVYGPTEKLLSVMVNHGETDEAALCRKLNSNLIKTQTADDFTFFAENVLFYGVPGCGKSYSVEQRYEKQVTNKQCKVRVVFHPDYTYSDFVGQLMPVLKEVPNAQGEKEEKLQYDFVPGPFTRILDVAYANHQEKCLLIIEELNRGNAPAIFGEIFQLLDRNDDGSSKYAIYNSDIANEVHKDKLCPIKLPPNLTIVATMNTSDQNVFTMDTAFQRRWQMKHIPNRFTGDSLDDKTIKHVAKHLPNSDISWGVFAQTVNKKMHTANLGFGGTDDKSLGVYFATDNDLDDAERFAEKVLKYLWDDAFKLGRQALFSNCSEGLSSVIEAYEDAKGDPLKAVLVPEVYNEMQKRMLELAAKQPQAAEEEPAEAEEDADADNPAQEPAGEE
ncbi:AAA family ATPase [Phascolarctobacterium succinatutens]|uniref:AAA family ATPase n=1 Tax=Phascolarctobacterium succinatutens TaxID=626940 RepID=UPI0026ED47E1|nr:AAA family ATPase [Phascolarctobacterium succinatutens]